MKVGEIYNHPREGLIFILETQDEPVFYYKIFKTNKCSYATQASIYHSDLKLMSISIRMAELLYGSTDVNRIDE